MNCKCKYYLTNISIMVGILALAFGVGVFLDRVLFVGESIAMLFVLGVFMIVGVIMAATYAIGHFTAPGQDDQ